METGPELAVGDGALGFWKALREVYGETRVQRCWVHKTANVLNQMPKSLQAKAKGHLHDIWMAETRADAEAAFDFFIAAYGAKYHKAAERLVKDRERLLSFYDFPAEHWKHIRTTNPIESTFATVRLRTVKTKGCLSRKTALAMAFKLILSARRKWRKLDGSNQLAETRRRSAVQGRNQDNQTRRLIAPSPTFGHSSGIDQQRSCQETKTNWASMSSSLRRECTACDDCRRAISRAFFPASMRFGAVARRSISSQMAPRAFC